MKHACELNNLCVIKQQNLGRRLGASKMNLSPPNGLGCCPFDGGGSGVVSTSNYLWGFWFWSLFCNAFHNVLSSFAITLPRKKELILLL